MTKKEETTVTYSLRFIAASDYERDNFKELFPQYEVDGGRYFKDRTKSVICVRLNKSPSLTPLKDFIKSRNGEYVHDVFISVSTVHDSEIIEIPDFVVNLIREVGGRVHFSFTSVPEM